MSNLGWVGAHASTGSAPVSKLLVLTTVAMSLAAGLVRDRTAFDLSWNKSYEVGSSCAYIRITLNN